MRPPLYGAQGTLVLPAPSAKIEPSLPPYRNMAATEQSSVPRKNSFNSTPWIDEVLRDLYASRDAYAEEHGNDLERIFADLMRREKASDKPPPARRWLCNGL